MVLALTAVETWPITFGVAPILISVMFPSCPAGTSAIPRFASNAAPSAPFPIGSRAICRRHQPVRRSSSRARVPAAVAERYAQFSVNGDRRQRV